ncbi:hypothetical protein DIJ64_06415 [Mycobacterium leprae]|uniref:Uncharacterized protein n=1 Tax=Mycobacterium leprae TaxID=1769 RepID=A0AAD0KSD6_MYCLR|nr:hypothetical protein DIJ64_06415 [Mycobacterium leprae]OAR20400.1 hypothetical protein A8144_10845 [Mycobacterium leprae 3125609]OAX70707.1 hypothetical protein A3216_10310 [Mycobacterium leprae 7935681]
MIITGGTSVFPVEVESALATHSGICRTWWSSKWPTRAGDARCARGGANYSANHKAVPSTEQQVID